MKWLVGLILVCATVHCTRAAERPEETRPLIDRFMTSLPYRVMWSNFEKARRPLYETGRQFVTMRCIDSAAKESSPRYLLLDDALLLDREAYPFFFPRSADSLICRSFVAPDGKRIEFKSTDKPPVPSDSVRLRLGRVFEGYSKALSNYLYARDDYSVKSGEVGVEIASYLVAVPITVALVASHNKDTRTAGYVCAGVLAIGVCVDIGSVFKLRGLKKKVSDTREVLERWDAETTRKLMEEGKPK